MQIRLNNFFSGKNKKKRKNGKHIEIFRQKSILGDYMSSVFANNIFVSNCFAK